MEFKLSHLFLGISGCLLVGCVPAGEYRRIGGSIGLSLPDFIPISLKAEVSFEDGTADGVRAARSDGSALDGLHEWGRL